ncbi:hypothetical protein BJY59DRAFT_646672, partial [Rhodotorula toruloides]
IAIDAPIQKRDSLLPSATSRKRLNAAGERKSGAAEGLDDGEDIPQEALTATERKRLQNTLSARRCRARKQARVQELEVQNAALRERVEQLEVMLRLVGGDV